MLSTLRLPLHGVGSFRPLIPAPCLVFSRPASAFSGIHRGIHRSDAVEKKPVSANDVALSWRSVKDLEAVQEQNRRNRERAKVTLPPGERRPVTRSGRFHNPNYPDGKDTLSYNLTHDKAAAWEAFDAAVAKKKAKQALASGGGDNDQFSKRSARGSSSMRQPRGRDDDADDFSRRFRQNTAPPPVRHSRRRDDQDDQDEKDSPWARPPRRRDSDQDGSGSRARFAQRDAPPERKDRLTRKDAPPEHQFRTRDNDKYGSRDRFTPAPHAPPAPERRWRTSDDDQDELEFRFTQEDEDESLARQSRSRNDDQDELGSRRRPKRNDDFPPRRSRGRNDDDRQDWRPSSFAQSGENDTVGGGGRHEHKSSRSSAREPWSRYNEEEEDMDEPPQVKRGRNGMSESSFFPAEGGREGGGAARRVREAEEKRAAAAAASSSSSSSSLRDGDGSSGTRTRTRKWDEAADDAFALPVSVEYTTAGSQFIYGRSSVKSALRIRRRKIYRLYVYQADNRRATATDDVLINEATRNNVSVKIISDQRVMDKMSQGRPHNGYVLEASTLPNPPVVSLSTVYDANDAASTASTREAKKPKHGFHVIMGSQTREDLAINGSSSFIPTATPPAKNKQPSRKPLVLVLDGVLDPGNLGALLRSAAFLGVSAVGITSHASSTLGPTALKAAAGAAEELPLFSVRIPLTDFLRSSRSAGWRIYAAVAPPSHALLRSVIKGQFQSLDEVERHQPLDDAPCVVVLGNEGFGLTVEVKRAANVELYIPRGSSAFSLVDSLNVSVAGALVCGSFLRKPATKKKQDGTNGTSTVAGAAEAEGADEALADDDDDDDGDDVADVTVDEPDGRKTEI